MPRRRACSTSVSSRVQVVRVVGPDAKTEMGIGWGSTVRELLAVFPDASLGSHDYTPTFSPKSRIRGGIFDWPHARISTGAHPVSNTRCAVR